MQEPRGAEASMKLLSTLAFFCFGFSPTAQVSVLRVVINFLTSRFLLTAWTNSCYSRRRAITAGRHFRVNWLFVYASARRHTLFTPLTEKPFMFQNWFHMLPLLSAWQCCWAATLSTGRLESGVASDAQCKYLYILSFCLCVNCRVS